MNPPSISVQILNFNGKAYLTKLLPSALKTNYPRMEIVLIDNGSGDGSVEFVRSKYPEVRIVENEINLGFAAAYNKSIALSDADWVVILNNDVTVDENWLQELVVIATTAPNIAALTPRIKLLEKPDTLNGCGGIMDTFGFCVNRGINQPDRGYDRVEEVFYAVGAAMMVRSSVWAELGGFDERYVAYFEDADWCWRARLAGYTVLYVPTSIVYHKWRGSWTNVRHRLYLYERHRLASLLKNYELRTLAWVLPAHGVLSLFRIVWLARHWGISEGLAEVEAYLWNMVHLGSTLKKRHEVQRKRVIADRELRRLLYAGSLEFSIRRDPYLSRKQ